MTPEQNFQFRMLVSNLLNSRATGESDARQLAHEDHLRNYVDGILDEKDAEIAKLEAGRDWPSLLTEFQQLVLNYRVAYENEEKDGQAYEGAGGDAWEALMSFFKLHVGTNAQGVPQSIVDAYEAYISANDDASSDNEYVNARAALIDAVGDIVNSQGEMQS